MGVLVAFLLAIELARDAPGAPALTVLPILCISPLFFAQSMLALLDMPAMCFARWRCCYSCRTISRMSAMACVALVLAKETGLAAVALFGVWLIAEKRWRAASWYLAPAVALAAWLLFLRDGTGHWLGNAEFTQYNVFYPLHPVRLGFALLRRLYYLFIGSGHFIGSAALLLAWRGGALTIFRRRAWHVAGAFVVVNVLIVSALGGAVLERYLLPVLPVLYIAFAIAICALTPRPRKVALAALLMCLLTANFIYPFYSFPFENNLAFVSFTELEKEAAEAVSVRPGTVATTFPMIAALRHPEFGYVSVRRKVIELKGFRDPDIQPLAAHGPDMIVVYDTAWDPLHLQRLGAFQYLLRRFYNFEQPLTPEEIAEKLSMRVASHWEHRGLTMALLVRDAPS